jgi:hypothetical protein
MSKQFMSKQFMSKQSVILSEAYFSGAEGPAFRK